MDIDDTILENILKYIKNLEVLDLTNCTKLTSDIGRIIREKCSTLITLNLHGITQVDDSTLNNLSHMQNLQDLDLSLCKAITDEGLIYLAKNKPNTLSKIILTCLIKITNNGLKELIVNNSESLIHLTANILPQKSVDGEFFEIIPKCKKLNYLDISGISNTQANYIDIIFMSAFEYLKYLNISGLTELTDAHIQSCLTNCKAMELIRASNCPHLTNAILDAIASLTADIENKFKFLEINRSPLISENKIEEVFKNCAPNLKISRATSQVWNMKNIGYRVPLIAKGFVKKDPKGKKGGAKGKKNDDKNPVNQLKKLLEESKPKRVIDLFAVKKGKKAKKSKKK